MDKKKESLKSLQNDSTKKSDIILTTTWKEADGKDRTVKLTGDLDTGMIVGIKYYGLAGDFKK